MELFVPGWSDIGLSPRVRGTLFVQFDDEFITRFIPACAGNADRLPAPGNRRTVHPRVCGERGVSVEALGRLSGSSPRVRGTPVTA